MSGQTNFFHYYVEGADEKKLLDCLKAELKVIRPGKVDCLNVLQCAIKPTHLRPLKPGTAVVLVFDTDTGSLGRLRENLELLQKATNVSEIILIPQVPNLEGELVRACGLRSILDLLNSRSRREFKSDLLRVNNLADKLRQHNFCIEQFWRGSPACPYHTVGNMADCVKLL